MKNLVIYLLFTFLIISCIPGGEEKPLPEYSTVKDNEGNVYKTVKIGEQWWMAEDMRASKFASGENINLINLLDTSLWARATKPAYTKGLHGNLYNYYTIEAGNIAPNGWHVATESDWQRLESHLGMSSEEVKKVNWRGTVEGDKIKQDYQLRQWRNYPNIWGTNETGFTAMPCGCRLFDGRICFPETSEQGFWWTATPTEKEVWFRSLDYKKSKIFRYYANKNYGYAIRCVKD